MEWAELATALVIILLAAELFTNGVEWLGEQFGLSEGAVGSVLAAVGTALPETILPMVAVLVGTTHGDEIGVGAILGAPFMLTTLAMFVVGIAVLLPSKIRRGDRALRGDAVVLRHDLGYFLVMYGLAIGAGLLHVPAVKWALAGCLVVGYVLYVRRHLARPGESALEREVVGEIRPLYLKRFLPDAFARGCSSTGWRPSRECSASHRSSLRCSSRHWPPSCPRSSTACFGRDAGRTRSRSAT